MSPWLIIALFIVACWLLGWALCRMSTRGDAADGQRNLVDLVAEQADQRDRADADDAHLGI